MSKLVKEEDIIKIKTTTKKDRNKKNFISRLRSFINLSNISNLSNPGKIIILISLIFFILVLLTLTGCSIPPKPAASCETCAIYTKTCPNLQQEPIVQTKIIYEKPKININVEDLNDTGYTNININNIKVYKIELQNPHITFIGITEDDYYKLKMNDKIYHDWCQSNYTSLKLLKGIK